MRFVCGNFCASPQQQPAVAVRVGDRAAGPTGRRTHAGTHTLAGSADPGWLDGNNQIQFNDCQEHEACLGV